MNTRKKCAKMGAVGEPDILSGLLRTKFDPAGLLCAVKPRGVGNCFEVAAECIVNPNNFGLTDAGIGFNEWNKEARLVHGMVTGQGPIAGREHAHAWVEYRGVVFDLANGRAVVMDRCLFYACARLPAVEAATYTRLEAMKQLVKHRHYGPWHTLPEDA